MLKFPPHVVIDMIKAQLDLEVDALTLADSTGMAHPKSIQEISGNVSTEDLVFMLDQMGIETGIDVHKVTAVSRNLEVILGKRFAGKMHSVLARKDIKIVRS